MAVSAVTERTTFHASLHPYVARRAPLRGLGNGTTLFTLVDVLEMVTLENGSTFYRVETVTHKGKPVSGFLRTKYIRATEITGERARKRPRVSM